MKTSDCPGKYWTTFWLAGIEMSDRKKLTVSGKRSLTDPDSSLVSRGLSDISKILEGLRNSDFSIEPGSGNKVRIIRIAPDLTMEFVFIPPGQFLMGSPESEGDPDEHPQHLVKFKHGFYLGKYAVTQDQWFSIMGKNNSAFKGARLPVDTVSWKDCQAFLKKLNQKTDDCFRLPTEAEWEYACRSGSRTRYYWGDAIDSDFCWFGLNSEGKTREVGKKKPNLWGLYDMSGNVWEWCQDGYSSMYYMSSPAENPENQAVGSRVLRGGSWVDEPSLCRSAARGRGDPVGRDCLYGFRLVYQE
ncbi:MAG: formylglycine-generating enzyme family protein [Candidatus Wallbacteria bacterium]|nr:formylglycine-generating enzyme family protein [Candidatus Wallbacteria bacterium]